MAAKPPGKSSTLLGFRFHENTMKVDSDYPVHSIILFINEDVSSTGALYLGPKLDFLPVVTMPWAWPFSHISISSSSNSLSWLSY